MSSVPIASGPPLPSTRSPIGRGGRLAAALPQVIEFIAVAAAIAALLPLFDRVAHIGPGRDQRFLDRGIAVAALPDAPIAELCEAYADLAETPVREAVCGARGGVSRAKSLATLPTALSATIERTVEAFATPMRDAAARIDVLQGQAQKGDPEAGDNADAVVAIEAEIAPFVDRYQLSGGAGAGPAPLRCAALWLEAAFPPRRANSLETDGADSSARANAALLLANALDGRAPATVAGDARLPPVPATSPSCLGAVETIAATAALMSDARQAVSNTRKNDAMRALVQSAGVQWAAAMAIGYAFLFWSRRAIRPVLGIAAAFAVWAAAAWLARVPWAFASRRGFLPARVDTSFASAPAGFVWCLVAAALVLCIASLVHATPANASLPPRKQSMSSRVGYAGLVIATGLGWILLFDLSINGHPGNRYLALYHQGHLWLAMLTLSTLLFLRQSLSRVFTWTLSVAGELARRAARRRGRMAVAARDRLADRGRLARLLVRPRQSGAAYFRARPRLADHRRRLVLFPARRSHDRAAGAVGANGNVVHRLRVADLCRRRRAGRGHVRHPRHGPAAHLRLRLGRVCRCGPGHVVASPQRPDRVGVRLGSTRFRDMDRRRHGRALPGRVFRCRHGQPPRKRRRAVCLDQRPAGHGVMVPGRRAGPRLRHRLDAVVRLLALACMQRRAGADPQRLHPHGDGRRVRPVAVVGGRASARRCGCIA